VADGTRSLALSFFAAAPGWYGIRKDWGADGWLNLDVASEWRYFVHNGLGQAIGVNLAFVTNVSGTRTTYQTRSGAAGGQVWLADGQQAEQVVSVGSADFSDKWALDSSPDTGVPRPTDGSLQQVESLYVRVYLANAALPANGTLTIDAVRIR
jgi:hypothetical protein